VNQPTSIGQERLEKKLHKEEFYNLYSPPNSIRVIKSRRMRCVEHVTPIRDMRNAYKILSGEEDWKGRDHSEDLGINGRIILKDGF
jgi:hypothetical protein